MIHAAIHWNVDPVLIHIGDGGIRWYSLGFLFAFFFGYWIMSVFFKREKVDVKYLDSLLMYAFVAVLVGARLGHCLFYQPDYFLTADHWMEIILPMERTAAGWHFTGYEGLASHGAAIGMLIALWLFYRKSHINPMWLLDRVVVVVALGGAFIRLGNLFNSEIYGVQTDLPWGVIFDRNGETVPKHPTQVYEALSYFLIFAVCIFTYVGKKGKLRNGILFGWWLIALFGVRFLIEFVKEEQVEFEQGMTLDMGQWLSVPFVVLGAIVCLLAYRGRYSQKIILKEKESFWIKKSSSR